MFEQEKVKRKFELCVRVSHSRVYALAQDARLKTQGLCI